MSNSEALRVLEHAHVPVHPFIGAPAGLPRPAARRTRVEALKALGRQVAADAAYTGEVLSRLQKAA